MSELVTAAAVIAPFITSAATSFAGAVVQSAQTAVTDSAVERGRVLLGRVLRREPDDPPETEQDAAAATAIAELSAEDREVLDTAVGEWLAGRDDLSADSLREHIRIAHQKYHAGDRNSATSYGNNSPAIGRLDTATFNYGSQPEQGGGS
ncbi:hypothetical protein AB0903_26805 [Streptomyces sp. NPDC048389]|uniref:hypothetical protein n=1 Tax=Streptomyces sp. NPDC048389 TaxID=3154622 RepID=UPI003452B285